MLLLLSVEGGWEGGKLHLFAFSPSKVHYILSKFDIETHPLVQILRKGCNFRLKASDINKILVIDTFGYFIMTPPPPPKNFRRLIQLTSY